MSYDTTIGDLTVKPMLGKDLIEVHPSIGTVDGKAYIGVWIPCKVENEKGKETYRELLHLVTQDKQLILANDEVFGPRGWRLTYKPIKFLNRWGQKDVNAFLSSSEKTVDPKNLFYEILGSWQRYIEFVDPREYLFQSLWAIGTYFHHLFKTYPYNYFTGPKRTGKTKCLTVLSCQCFNTFFSNNMSTSSIYRLIQNAKGTLLIDETEKLSNPERALEFRSILLSGYKKGAVVFRVEKTKKEMLIPEAFEVYGAKALANITGIEDVLEDRCKVTVIRRSIDRAVTDNLVDVDSECWSELRNRLYLLYLGYWHEVHEEYVKICELSEHSELVNVLRDIGISREELEYLTSRELELWAPILALARFFDNKGVSLTTFTYSLSSLHSLFHAMVSLACESAKQRHIEDMTETGDTILVQILKTLVTSDNYYSVKEIKDKMQTAFDEEQKWLTTKWIGNALRRLGFKDKHRVGTGYQYKLNMDEVNDLAKRMGNEETEPKKETEKKEEHDHAEAHPDNKELGVGDPPTPTPSISETLSKVKYVSRVNDPFNQKCPLCHNETLLLFKVQQFDGYEFFVCEDCGQRIMDLNRRSGKCG